MYWDVFGFRIFHKERVFNVLWCYGSNPHIGSFDLYFVMQFLTGNWHVRSIRRRPSCSIDCYIERLRQYNVLWCVRKNHCHIGTSYRGIRLFTFLNYFHNRHSLLRRLQRYRCKAWSVQAKASTHLITFYFLSLIDGTQNT